MERIKRSWRLFKASFKALACHKKLLIFLALSAAGAVAMALFFFGGLLGYIAMTTGFDALGKREEAETTVVATASILALVTYLIAMVASTFLNVAFYGEILRALSGEEVSIKRGLRLALSKIMPIIIWSLFAGIVGYIIKTLEENMGLLGKLAMSFIGMAWSVASVFVIPAIAMDTESRINPVGYLKMSAAAIRKTWGESLAGYAGFSILTGMAAFLIVILLIGGVAITAFYGILESSIGVIIAAAILLVLALVAFIFVCGVAERIYLCALYKYATEGIAPEHFSQEDLNSAWKTKKQ